MAQEGLNPDLRPDSHYTLPEALRRELAHEFGPVHQKDDLPGLLADAECVVAVGDVVSLTLNQLGIQPTLFVVDYITERGKGSEGFKAFLGNWGHQERTAHNPAGAITREAWDEVRAGLQEDGTTRLVIDGEEDLLGMPVFVEAPIGCKVLYGSPGRGVVVVTVDEAMKEKATELLGRFEHR